MNDSLRFSNPQGKQGLLLKSVSTIPIIVIVYYNNYDFIVYFNIYC